MAIYAKIGKIDGDATHDKHQKWLTIDSLQWGVGRAIHTPVGSASNREASEPSVSEVTISKQMDEASPTLFAEACTGKATEVKIHLVTTGNPGDTYMEYTLTDAMISAYSMSSGGDRPSESLSLNFTKIETKYTPYDANHKPGNPITTSYDLKTAKKA
ncbi:type VI secretion system tube protein Hcp [Rhodospirillaceae bacterium SYSU D60014]|jgi:type VI secretion system secreted protein Hcp|uniref:Hcp family type VI secretion system effector n=1 Tax=Virgifigura deserti TaxID=2268457 RepID=UPI000E66831B